MQEAYPHWHTQAKSHQMEKDDYGDGTTGQHVRVALLRVHHIPLGG